MSLLTNLIENRNNLTTYQVGLLQAKVYRILKQRTTLLLKPYTLSTVDWAYLGVLFDRKSPIRSSEMALELDVELPFITELSGKLEKKGLIVFQKDPSDGRIKHLILTKKGTELVPTIESILRKDSKEWLGDIGIRDILTYVTVLKKIAAKNKVN